MTRVLVVFAAFVPLIGGAQTVPQWRLVEEWRKGGEVEGAYAFDGMLSMRYSMLAVAPGRRLVALDSKSSRVHIYDTAGTVIRSIGGGGSGPGEFQIPPGIAIAHDGTMVINDPRNGRLVLFKANGDFDRTVTMVRRPPFAFDIAWDGSFDTNGRLLQSLALPPKQPRPAGGGPPVAGDSALMTERLGADLTRSDSIPLCYSPRPATQDPSRYLSRTRVMTGISLDRGSSTGPAPVTASWPIPFTEQRSPFVRDREGFAWSSVSSASGELVRTNGRNCSVPTARITLRGARAAVPSSVRDSAASASHADMRPLIPRQYPWFRALRVDDQNRLWVERDVSGGKRFDVFSANGASIAEVELPPQLATDLPIAIGHNRVYGFVKDADDVPYLVAWSIVTGR